MFSKKKRVTKELFLAIMKHGKVVSGSLFLFRFIPQNEPQYAFVAPKGIVKSAVLRNRLRRKGYNSLRSLGTDSGAGIFFYKKESLTASTSDITFDIKQILDKIRIKH